MVPFGKYTVSSCDDYFTPKALWAAVAHLIPGGKTIWEPFYHPSSKSAQYLQELTGNKVVWEDVDFFNTQPPDANAIVVSNPPFTKKKEVLARLFALDVPFILIIPSQVIHTQYAQQMFRIHAIQVVVPHGRMHFTNTAGVVKKGTNFDCCYLCYKMNLPTDIVFLPPPHS